MSKEEIVISKNVGYYFSVSIEFEDKRDPNNPVAAGNKVVTKYLMSGNVETELQAQTAIITTRQFLKTTHNGGLK